MIAFYHDVETASGIITKYHKITYIALEYSDNKVTQMLIDSWVSKEAHDNNKYSLDRNCVYLPVTPPDDLPVKELFKWGYEQLISPEYVNSYNVYKYTGCIKDENYNGN